MKVYFLWGAKNLFPQYVPVRADYWMRFDEFIKTYGDMEGMIPEEEMKAMGAKKFLEWVKQFEEKRQQKAQEEAERQEAEEERRRQEELAEMLNDPEYNPNRIAVNDLVYNKNEGGSNHGKLYKVSRIRQDRYGDYTTRGDLIAYLEPQEEPGDELQHDVYSDRLYRPVKSLYKADDENRATRHSMIQDRENARRQAEEERERQLHSLLTNPAVNPNGIKVGDSVFVKDVDSVRNAMRGIVREILPDQDNDYDSRPRTVSGYTSDYVPEIPYGLIARIAPEADDDYHNNGWYTSRKYPLQKLFPTTPENTRIRQYNVQQATQQATPVAHRSVEMPPEGWTPQPDPRLVPPIPDA